MLDFNERKTNCIESRWSESPQRDHTWPLSLIWAIVRGENFENWKPIQFVGQWMPDNSQQFLAPFPNELCLNNHAGYFSGFWMARILFEWLSLTMVTPKQEMIWMHFNVAAFPFSIKDFYYHGNPIVCHPKFQIINCMIVHF